ncbi:TetR family transcriptional regulator [Tabrizicola sp.]|uniref:TetR/AcrR family transcriptional regulator n=1 Tax=Tabrizicola sp. TaxID=2005166 RepID=UPI001A3D0B63|nr:TetR family transcriptional regulator [Tabrizicola sp.]MBL9063081.1 TetR family transcriptional regulator [Tabrizicola sp.]
MPQDSAPDRPEEDARRLTKAGRADRRHLRGQASLQRIIDATIATIAEEGLPGVTMQRIARRIASSNALVVFHFGNKDQLFRAVIEYLNDQFARHWETHVRAPGLTTPERLVAALDCARSFSRLHPDWVAAWVIFASDRQTMLIDHSISLPSDRAYLDEVRTMLAEVAAAGGRVVDVDSLAEGLNYLVQGAWYWDTVNLDRPPSDALRKTGLSLLRQAFPQEFAGF